MSFQEHWLALNRIPWGGLQAGNAVLEPELLCSLCDYDLISDVSLSVTTILFPYIVFSLKTQAFFIVFCRAVKCLLQ